MRNILLSLLGGIVLLVFGASFSVAEEQGAVSPVATDSDMETTISASADPFVIPAALKKFIEDKKAPAVVTPEEPEAPVVTQETPEPEPLPPPELPKVSLTGLIYGVEKPLAVINGQVYAEGETVPLSGNAGIAQIRSISDGKVVLLYVGVEHTITMDMQDDPKSGQ